MSASISLLDKYKKTCSMASDNACAIALGVTRSAVSLWRNGKGHPEADTVEKMCEAIGEPMARWLPLIEAERARTPAARKAWLRLAQVAAAITLAVGIYPAHAEVSKRVEAGFSTVPSIHYAQSRVAADWAAALT